MMTGRKGFYLTAAFLAASIVFTGCGNEKPKNGEAPKAGAQQGQPQGPTELLIRTAAVEGRTVERSVEAVGTLHPWDEIKVSNEVPGIVEKVVADLGDKVKAGDTLAVLDQKEAKLNLDEAEAAYRTTVKAQERENARLKDAKTTLKRYDELFKQGMVSESQFDNARTQYDVAEAQANEASARVEQARAKANLAKKRLSDTVIKAPISGEVWKRSVSTGEALKEKTTCFTVVSSGTLKFRGAVAEAAVPKIKSGQEVLVSVEAFKDTAFKGRLTRISPAIDTQTRTLEVEASVPNEKGVLKPGFFARGIILTKKESNVPFVPDSAVYTFVGITKIFVIEGGKAHERLVKTGARDGAMVEILENLKPGEMVATTNLSNLFDGSQVKIADSEIKTKPETKK